MLVEELVGCDLLCQKYLLMFTVPKGGRLLMIMVKQVMGVAGLLLGPFLHEWRHLRRTFVAYQSYEEKIRQFLQ